MKSITRLLSSPLAPFIPLALLVLVAPLAVDPLSAEPLGHIKRVAVLTAAVGMILAWAFMAWGCRERTHVANPLLATVLVSLLAVLVLSSFQAHNHADADDEVNRVILLLGMFAAAAHIRWNPTWLRVFLAAALVPALWIAFTVIMEYTGHLSLLGVRVVFYRMDHRVLAFFGHNNVTAQYLLVASCWAHVQLQGSRTRAGRWGFLAALSLLLAGQYFTFCRSGWLSTLCGYALAIHLFKRSGTPGRQLASRLAMAALAAVALVLAVKAVAPSVDSLGFRASQWKEAGIFHHISSGRFAMWGASLRLAFDHLLTGVGPGNYWVMYGWYDPMRTDFVRYAHNDYLQILGEYGLLGAGVLAAAATAGILWIRSRSGSLGAGSDAGLCALALASGLLGAAADASLSYDFYLPVSSGLFAAGAGILVALLRRPSAPPRPMAPWLRPAVALTLLFVGMVEARLISRHWEADRAKRRSIDAFNQGDIGRAIEESVRATRLKPGEAGYENALAVMLHRTGEPQAALRHYEAARLLSPYEAHNYAGILNILKGGAAPKELLHWYEATLQALPHRQDIRNEQAYLLSSQGFHQDAAAAYERILARTPNDPVALLNLGNTYLKLSEFGRALPIFRRLVALGGGTLDPPPGGDLGVAIDIARGLAVSLDGMEQTEEAYGILRQWLRKRPGDLWCHLVEIDIGLRHQDRDRIRQAARAARAIDPEIPLSPEVETLLKP